MRRDNANEAITRRGNSPLLTPQSVNIPILYPCSEDERDGAAYVFERSANGECRTVARSVEAVSVADLQEYFVSAREVRKRETVAAQFKQMIRKYGELDSLWHGVWIDDINLANALEDGLIDRAHNLIDKHLGIRSGRRQLVDRRTGHYWRDDDYADADLARKERNDPMAFLAGHINNGLSEVLFVVWQDDKTKKLRPGIYCFLTRQLAYAALITQLGQPGSVAFCKRCGTQFERMRSRNQYCSSRCRVAAAMKRYRARKKRRKM